MGRLRREVTIRTSIEIDARPERVWPHLVDWENLGRWMKEGTDFRVTSPHREGKGVTAAARITIGGVSTHDRVRVTEWAPPGLLEVEHLGWVGGRGRIRCSTVGGKTHVEWDETLAPPLGPAGAVGIRLFHPVLKRTFSRDLRCLKDLVEREVEPGDARR